MTHGHEKPFNVYERLGSIRLTAAERREAIVQMQRAEAIADLILRGAGLLRRAAAGVGRA
jgi:bacterioferritin (cytochrome b1)